MLPYNRRLKQANPDEAFCPCGKKLTGWVEKDPRAEEPVGYPDLCPDCQNRNLAGFLKRRDEQHAREAVLLDTARPRWTAENQALRLEWLGARQQFHKNGKPARVRNRCPHCGGRAVKDVGHWCALCRDAHRRQCLRRAMLEMPYLHHRDILMIELRKWSVAAEPEFAPLHAYMKDPTKWR